MKRNEIPRQSLSSIQDRNLDCPYIQESDLDRPSIEKENVVSRKSLLLGITLVFISNIAYLGNNYVIKWGELQATEISMVRGAAQIVMFGVLFIREKKCSTTTKSFKPTPTIIVQLMFFGFLMATLTFACLAAIPLMPIGDLIVLCFTSPAFTVFISRIMIKTRITILNIFLSFTMIVGSILVVQPPFIFGDDTRQMEVMPEMNNSDIIELPSPIIAGEVSINQTLRFDEEYLPVSIESTGKDINYYIGVGLCVFAALNASIVCILSTKLSSIGVSNNLLMVSAGAFEFILSFAFLPLLTNRIISGISLGQKSGLMLPLSVGLTTIAFWFITLSLDKTRDPTLINMLRASEIILSFITESIYHQKLPEYLSLIGSMLVLVCVLLMPVHDKIYDSCSKKIIKSANTTSKHSGQIIEKI